MYIDEGVFSMVDFMDWESTREGMIGEFYVFFFFLIGDRGILYFHAPLCSLFFSFLSCICFSF